MDKQLGRQLGASVAKPFLQSVFPEGLGLWPLRKSSLELARGVQSGSGLAGLRGGSRRGEF